MYRLPCKLPGKLNCMNAIEARRISNINSDKVYGAIINAIESKILIFVKEGEYSCSYHVTDCNDAALMDKVVRYFTIQKYNCNLTKSVNGCYLHISW